MRQLTTIVGKGAPAAVAALSRMLKKNNERWIVLDYTGRLGLVLHDLPGDRLKPETTSWLDLANRCNPAGVFQLHNSPQLPSTLNLCLQQLRAISGFALSNMALQWLTEVGTELSKHGNVTLYALLRSISSPDIRSWFIDNCPDQQQLETARKMIAWCLGFPAVYSFSEGFTARQRANWLQGKHKVIWFEMLSEHFEHYEHRIITTLLASVVTLQLHEIVQRSTRRSGRITVIHGFPPAGIEKIIAPCMGKTDERIHHLFVYKIFPPQKPRTHVLEVIRRSTSLWVTPLHERIDPEIHKDWINKDECKQINHLGGDRLFLKDRRQEKCIVAKVKTSNRLPLPHILRHHSLPVKVAHPCRLQQRKPLLRPQPKPLYAQLCTREMLQMAWLKVRNGRNYSHGIDGVTIAAFSKQQEQQLALLSRELRNKTYRPRPLRRVYIPKPDGSQREIGIGCVRDRIVQTVCLMLIEPFHEPDFSRFSFAFRPRRNAHQALTLAAWYISNGYKWVVTADIRKCFDSIDQQILLEMLAKKIGDKDILDLISNWMTVDVIDFQDVVPILSGVPQGAVLSPFLANVYLDPLDKFFEKSQYAFVRYADDILLFTADGQTAKNTLQSMESFLRDSLHLALKPAKTQYLPVETGFDFLGFTLQGQTLRIRDKKLKKIGHALEEQIKALGHQHELKGIFEHMSKLNSFIRGVRNYFSLPLPGTIENQLQKFDIFIEKIALHYLPESLQQESIWQMRQRFFLPEPEQETIKNNAIARGQNIGSGYPQDEVPATPEDYTANQHEKQAVMPRDDGRVQEKDSFEPLVTEDNQLHIFQHGCLLTCDAEYIVLKKKKKKIWKRRLTDTAAIFVQGKGNSITTSLQIALSIHTVPMFLLTLTGDIAVVAGPPINRDKAKLRIQQAMRHDDPVIVRAGLAMLAAKTGNQAALLKYFAKYRRKKEPETATCFRTAASEINGYAQSIRELSPGLAMIRRVAMGLEGKAASVYWRSMAKLLPDALQFSSRKTLGAKDIFNQCLNYAYSLLYGEVWQAVYANGLDPCFGIMHSSLRDNGSLIYDIIEEFRVPFVDRLVFSMIGRGFIPAIGQDGRLLLRTRKALLAGFLKRWQKEMSWRSHRIAPVKILQTQVKSIARLFQNQGIYKPFRMKW